MTCAWCRQPGARIVRRNGIPSRSSVTGLPLYLCFRCWGFYRESGQRRDLARYPLPSLRGVGG